MSKREEILGLLSGKKTNDQPAFSGLIHVTAEGLQSEGLLFHEVHQDAHKMARAAARTFRLTGIPSAALPLDLCAPTETLGAELDFYKDREYYFPQIKKALFESTREIAFGLLTPPGIGVGAQRGRFGMICDAIAITAQEIGREVAISGIIPGPYTLLLYLCNPQKLFVEMKKEPQIVREALGALSRFLVEFGKGYRDAGSDYLTIHEMGGSPGFIGPVRFEQFVVPAVQELIAELPKQIVLSVCGNMNKSLALLNDTGAAAISIDQTSDLHAARAALKDTLLFGNLDPVATLWRGDEAQITEAVRAAKESGVDAVWPGCDLVPQTPSDNLKAFIKAS